MSRRNRINVHRREQDKARKIERAKAAEKAAKAAEKAAKHSKAA